MNAIRSKSVTARTRVFVALAFTLTVAMAGCSQEDDPGVASIDDDDSTSSSSSAPADSEKSPEKFEACLKEYGVDPNDLGVSIAGGAGNPEDDLSPAEEQAIAEAEDACKKYLPVEELSAEEHSELLDGALKHAQCLRDKGFDVPDPEMVDGGVRMPPNEERGFDDDDPDFQKADKECAEQHMPEMEDSNKSGDGP